MDGASKTKRQWPKAFRLESYATTDRVMGSDGLPVDRLRRNAATRLLGDLKKSEDERGHVDPWWTYSQHIHRLTNGMPDPAARGEAEKMLAVFYRELIEDLFASGYLSLTEFSRVIRSRPASFASSGDADVYDHLVEKISSRFGWDRDRRTRLAQVFVDARNIVGIYETDTERGRAVVVPSAMGFLDGRLRATRATVFVIAPHDIEVWDLGGDAFRFSSESLGGGRKEVSVDLRFDGKDASTGRIEDEQLSLLGFFSFHTKIPEKAAPSIVTEAFKGSLSLLKKDLDGALGWSTDQAQYHSIAGTVRNKGLSNLRWRFQTVLSKNLDPEIRKAAMRIVSGNVADYRWLCGTDGTTRRNRLQASARYPVLTPYLKRIEAVIDAGGSVDDGLSDLFGIEKRHLRKLAGYTWQKAGARFQADIDPDKPMANGLAEIFRILPDSTDIADTAWAKMLEDAGICVADKRARLTWMVAVGNRIRSSRIGWTPPFVEAAVRDLIGLTRVLESKELADAVEHASRFLGRFVDPENGCEGMSVRNALLKAIVKPDGGLKGLWSFSDRWHRNVGVFLEREAAFRRRMQTDGDGVRERIGTWIGGGERFEFAGGSIDWLTSAESLRDEGAVMNHCVGSFHWSVEKARHVIGHVRGRDGGVSTICLEMASGEVGGDISVVQHLSTSNIPAPASCVHVVEELERAIETGEIEVDWVGVAACREAHTKKEKLGSDPLYMFGQLVVEDASAAMDMIRPILPRTMLDWSPQKWIEVHASLYGDTESATESRVVEDVPF
jgi:hypothetical protein